jgi:LPXTG-motif cell wall-anchored protein
MMLVPTVSRAQVSLDQLTSTTVDSLSKPVKKVGVPEPDTNLLLLIGLGVTGLVGYYVQRRKRAA